MAVRPADLTDDALAVAIADARNGLPPEDYLEARVQAIEQLIVSTHIARYRRLLELQLEALQGLVAEKGGD